MTSEMELDERNIMKDILKGSLERDLQTMCVVARGSQMKVMTAEFVMDGNTARLDRFSLLNNGFSPSDMKIIVHMGLPTPTDFP